MQVELENLDKHQGDRFSRSSTFSVVERGSTVLPIFCMSGRRRPPNLKYRWKNGTSLMGSPQIFSHSKFKQLLQRIADGEFDAILMSPPCGTWSRAPWANAHGPRPLRSCLEPWGFPWLEGPRRQKVDDSNSMIELCLQVMELLEGKDYVTAFLLEHPEDLGAVATFKRKAKKLWFQPIASTVRPASIWQLQRLRSLEHHAKVCTRVFHQCLFGATSPKPTRILTSLQYLNTLGWTGWPELHPATGVYQGPLPYRCTCGASHQQLIARGSDGSFLTTAAAAYPPRLDELFATAVWDWITSLHRLKRVETNAAVVINEMDTKNVKTNAAVGINEMETKDDLKAKNDLEAKNDSEAKNDLVVNNDAVPKNDLPADVFIAVKKDGAIGGSRRSEAGPSVGPPSKKIRRSQLEVWYKGDSGEHLMAWAKVLLVSGHPQTDQGAGVKLLQLWQLHSGKRW